MTHPGKIGPHNGQVAFVADLHSAHPATATLQPQCQGSAKPLPCSTGQLPQFLLAQLVQVTVLQLFLG